MSFTDLPLLDDLLKEHTCEKPKDGSPCTCAHVSTKKSKLPVLDKRLQHWEKWMQKRRKVHQKLGQLLAREPGDLVMNSAEELRTVKEEKLALEYTKVPEPDRQRGCPGFWKIPVGLKDECGKNETYLAVLTKEDKCIVPEIEHVGLPRLTMEEKDVFPRTRNSRILWEKSAYVQDKTAELSYNLNKIRPHKPNFDDLFIEGVSTSKLSENRPVQIRFSGTKIMAEPEKSVSSEPEESPSVASLFVNDLQLSPHNMTISGTRKVYVLFECDISISKKVITEYITLKNPGTVTLRFYWKKSEKVEFFKDIIPDKSHEIYFYFNKNEGIIIPGQTIQFPIWFKTQEAGTYYEQWEFYTKPRIMPVNSNLVIVLQASVIVGDLDRKMAAVREQLNKNIRDRLIKESLFAVTSNISYDTFKPTVYSYNKKEVFETINSQFDPVRHQPKYLYNKQVVRELQKFYKKVRRPSDPKIWNYRIEELKLLARAKQRKEEHLKWLAQQEAAKRVYEERPQFPTLPCEKNIVREDKPLPKGEKSDAQKPDETGKTEQLVDAKPFTEQLELIISKLECTAVEKTLDQDKFTQAYLILCTYFDKISQEFEDLEDKLGIIKNPKYPKFASNYVAPLYYKPTRLIKERLYEVLQGPPVTGKVGTKTDQPAAEALQVIPAEDTKRRYRTYYNLPDTPPPELEGKKKGGKDDKKGGKGDKKGGKDDKKSGKDDKKGGKKGKAEEKPAADSDEEDGYVVNESFDPYAALDLPVPEAVEEETKDEEIIRSNIDAVLPAALRQYKYNMYIIMYNYLDKAVSNIVDMIEMQPKENLPYAVIKEFEEPKFNRRLIDLKGLVAEESAEQLKAKLLVYKYRKYSKADWKSIEIQRQLKSVRSESSLWSVLRPFETKPKLPESKPISYPIDHYDTTSPTHQTVENQDEIKSEKLKDLAEDKPSDEQEPQLMVNMSTSTLEGGVLDPNWEDFKEVGLQKHYGEEEEPEDLVAYIENIVSQTSIRDLVDIQLDKATQKKSEEHVSDEEHFYDSESDIDTETIEPSVNSEQSEEASCGCEGLGVCSVPAEEYCSCEGLGICSVPAEEYCSCEGLGICSVPTEEYCSCEGLGICSVPAEEYCSCEGYGECNQPLDLLHRLELYSGMEEDEGLEENEEPYQFIPLLKELSSYGDVEEKPNISTQEPHKCEGECK